MWRPALRRDAPTETNAHPASAQGPDDEPDDERQRDPETGAYRDLHANSLLSHIRNTFRPQTRCLFSSTVDSVRLAIGGACVN